MANQKSADDLSAILADQLDALTSAAATRETIKFADAIANIVGKELKLSALRLAYARHVKDGGAEIPALESKKYPS